MMRVPSFPLPIAKPLRLPLAAAGALLTPAAILSEGSVVPPPALPLTAPKVMGVGHSFVLGGVQYNYRAGNTETGGAAGVITSGRGVLSLVETLDGGRYNLDIFAEWGNLGPGLSVSGGQGYGGRLVARGGAGLKLWGAGLTIDLNANVSHIIARHPDIVVIDIGINDLIYAYANGGTVEEIIGLYQTFVRRLRDAGIWCVLMTVTWSNTAAFSGSDATAVAWKAALNDAIVAIDGNDGVRVCNTLDIDGQDTDIGSHGIKYFFDTNLHPTDKLNLLRAERLMTVLQGMTVPHERRDLDELTGNLSPNPGLTGTTGTKTGSAVSGNLAAGFTFVGPASGGTSTIVLAKEAISGSSDEQVITITNGAPAGTTATVTLRPSAAATLAALGLAGGDWLRWYCTVELDDWAGWDFDASTDGPVKIQLPLNTGSTLIYQGSSAASVRNRSMVMTGLLEIPVGLPADNIRWNSTFMTLRWSTAAAGSGVCKISKLKITKLAVNPRTAWAL